MGDAGVGAGGVGSPSPGGGGQKPRGGPGGPGGANPKPPGIGPPIGGGGGPWNGAANPGGGPGGGGGGGPTLTIQAKAIAATVPTEPSSTPATPAPITTPVGWRRRSGAWWATGAGAGGLVLMSSFVVMPRTLRAGAEVDLKKSAA